MTYTVIIHMAHGLSEIRLTDCTKEAADKFRETVVGVNGFLRFPVENGSFYNIAVNYIAWIEIRPES